MARVLCAYGHGAAPSLETDPHHCQHAALRCGQSAGRGQHTARDVAHGRDDGGGDRRRLVVQLHGGAGRRLAHEFAHAGAGLSAFAYAFARRHAGHGRYTFGTWKIEVLGGYTSAIFLLGIAALMIFQSLERLMKPQTIHYDEAIAIAVVGLAVNLLCAWWLRGLMITQATTMRTTRHDHSMTMPSTRT